MVVYRDPDNGTEVAVFVDGRRDENVGITVVDPGRGHTRADWDDSAALALEGASPAAVELLTDWYAQAENSPHITGDHRHSLTGP